MLRLPTSGCAAVSTWCVDKGVSAAECTGFPGGERLRSRGAAWCAAVPIQVGCCSAFLTVPSWALGVQGSLPHPDCLIRLPVRVPAGRTLSAHHPGCTASLGAPPRRARPGSGGPTVRPIEDLPGHIPAGTSAATIIRTPMARVLTAAALPGQRRLAPTAAVRHGPGGAATLPWWTAVMIGPGPLSRGGGGRRGSSRRDGVRRRRRATCSQRSGRAARTGSVRRVARRPGVRRPRCRMRAGHR